MPRRSRSTLLRFISGLSGAGLAAPALLGFMIDAPLDRAQAEGVVDPTPASPAPADLLQRVENRSLPRADRVAAAVRLLDNPEPSTQQDFLRLLRSVTAQPTPSPEPSADPSAILFEAIASLPSAPEWLFHDLTVAARSEHPHRLTAIRALGSLRIRAALSELVALTRNSTAPLVADAAFTALERLTARADIPRDPAAWERYLTSISNLSDAQWQRDLIDALASRLDAARASERLVVDRLTDIARQQLAAAPGAQAELLTAMVTDASPAVRRAGLSLALQELANARPVQPALAGAAEPSLTDPDPSLRRLAAELIFLLAPPEAATAIHRALVKERDPTVAAALLQGPIRWPSPVAMPAIIRWLDDATTLERALDALAAADAAGLDVDPADRDRVLTLLRASPPADTSTSRIRLLLAWGNDQDLDQLRARLASSDAAVRRRIAEAIALHPRALALLMDHASLPEVFPSAARAAAAQPATLERYRSLASAAANLPDARPALIQVASRLPTADLLVVAQEQTDLAFRDSLLQPLVLQPLRSFTSPFSGTRVFSQAPGVAEGLVLLARTRLDLRQPAAALQALDAIVLQPTALTSECADLRTLALIQLARQDEAVTLASGPSIWVQALENVATQPQAVATLNIIESRFGSQLDAELAARVVAVRERLGLTFGPSLSR